MKAKILIKRFKNEDGTNKVLMPEIIHKGEFIDLKCAQETKFKAPQSGTLKSKTINGKEEKYRNVSFDFKYIPLGIAMKLPDGYEAILVPRSSTCKGMGLIQGNSIGVIDNTFAGNEDEWKFPAIAIRDTTIKVGERICQFRIQLSQKATIWQRIKWLFTDGVEFVEVDSLEDESRGGLGSTGNN